MSDQMENKKYYQSANKLTSADISPVSSYSVNYSDETSISYEQSFSSLDDQYEQESAKNVELKEATTAKPKYTSFNIDSLIMNDNKPDISFTNNISNNLFLQSAFQFPLMTPQLNNHFLFNQVSKLQQFYSYLYCMQAYKN